MFRIASEEDFDIVLDYFNKTVEESKYASWYPKEVREHIVRKYLQANRNEKVVLLILDEDKTIGMCSFYIIPIEDAKDTFIAKLASAYLDEDYRGKKITKKIVEALEFWAKKVGASFTDVGVSMEGVDLSKDGYKKYEILYMKDIR